MATATSPDNPPKQRPSDFEQFLQFLSFESRPDLRQIALGYLQRLSGSSDGLRLFAGLDQRLVDLTLPLLLHQAPADVSEEARQAVQAEKLTLLRLFVNFSANSTDFGRAVAKEAQLVGFLVERLLEEDEVALAASQLLSNLTAEDVSVCSKVWTSIRERMPDFVRQIVGRLNLESWRNEWSGFTLRNVSRLPSVRLQLADAAAPRPPVFDLLPLILQSSNPARKALAVDLVRNCSLDQETHTALLKGEDVLLATLLLPLIGPEELSESENEALPIDLQFMGSEKTREPDAAIRLKLLEVLYQLCASREGRERMRDKGVYPVLREYHAWETDAAADVLCGNVVNVLIRTEEEMLCDNLHDVALADAELDI